MIKVFNSTNEYDNYIKGGLVAGDLYYVLADGSVHFRTNNIDGTDKVYNKGDGGSTEPEWITVSTNAEGEYRLSTETGKVYEFLFPSDQDFQIPGFINDLDDFISISSLEYMGNSTHKYLVNNRVGYKALITNTLGTQASFQYRKLN